ncbi:MAG: DDE-type integrase/transposase/recombinase [bacterium]|nr:DDE-type integrase/transposase/recombinase [bacterium]
MLERWARVSKAVKRKALKLNVYVRGSLRRTAGYLAEEEELDFSWTTILWWVRKAGRESVELEKVIRIRWSGKLAVDEKWVKLLDKWVYVYVAVDAVTGEVLCQEVFGQRGKDSARSFLLMVKALGYRPDVVITDLCGNYSS